MSSKSNVLIAAVAGLAVGIGLGMILAPERGSKTRKKISNKIRDIADSLEEGIPGAIEEFRNIIKKDNGDPDDEAHEDSGASSKE
jgi:gas vesicle protein